MKERSTRLFSTMLINFQTPQYICYLFFSLLNYSLTLLAILIEMEQEYALNLIAILCFGVERSSRKLSRLHPWDFLNVYSTWDIQDWKSSQPLYPISIMTQSTRHLHQKRKFMRKLMTLIRVVVLSLKMVPLYMSVRMKSW
jgi:hypothetical protein